MKKLLGLGLILGLWLGLAGVAAAQTRIAVADVGKIMAESGEGKRAQETIKKKSEDLSKGLQREDQEMVKMVEEFRKQSGVMKEDAKKRRQEEITKRGNDLQKRVADAEKQLAQFKEKELGPIFQKMEGVLKALAQEEKVDLILDKSHPGVLFADPKIDVTEKVRSRFK